MNRDVSSFFDVSATAKTLRIAITGAGPERLAIYLPHGVWQVKMMDAQGHEIGQAVTHEVGPKNPAIAVGGTQVTVVELTRP